MSNVGHFLNICDCFTWVIFLWWNIIFFSVKRCISYLFTKHDHIIDSRPPTQGVYSKNYKSRAAELISTFSNYRQRSAYFILLVIVWTAPWKHISCIAHIYILYIHDLSRFTYYVFSFILKKSHYFRKLEAKEQCRIIWT